MLRAVAVVALLTAVMAGCGSVPEVEPSEPADSDSPTVRVELTSDMEMSEPGWLGAHMTMTGVVNFESGDYRLSIESDGARDDHLGVAGVAYSSWSDPFLPKGKRWTSERQDASEGEPLAEFAEVNLDPRAVLDQLVERYGPLQEVGHEQLDGVETRHLRGHWESPRSVVIAVDHSTSFSCGFEFGESVSPDPAEDEPPDATEHQQTGEVDVWIDDRGFARRVLIERAGEHRTTMKLRFFDFGTPLKVEAPPAEEVIAIEDAITWMEEQATEECE